MLGCSAPDVEEEDVAGAGEAAASGAKAQVDPMSEYVVHLCALPLCMCHGLRVHVLLRVRGTGRPLMLPF